MAAHLGALRCFPASRDTNPERSADKWSQSDSSPGQTEVTRRDGRCGLGATRNKVRAKVRGESRWTTTFPTLSELVKEGGGTLKRPGRSLSRHQVG